MRSLTLTLTLFVVSTSLALAQDRPSPQPPDSARQRAAAQFHKEHGSGWQISWHPKTGTPATVMNGTARGFAGPPEQAARAFLKTHKDLFGIENANSGLEVVRTNRSETGSSQVQFRQVYRGLPVLNSGYLVAVNSKRAIHYVSGDFYPDLEVDTSPRLQPSDVVETIRSDLGGGLSFAVRQEPVLSIFVDDTGEQLVAHLAYEARAERREPLEAYKYLVDAHSGEILQKISLIKTVGQPETQGETRRQEPTVRQSGVSSATATGSVYLTNPLHGSPTSVTLHRLNNVSPQILEGENVAVTNKETFDAESSSGDFTYNYWNTHFDEVMVYYHSDEFEDWLIKGLGMPQDQLPCQVDIMTHSSRYYARTFPTDCAVYYGDGITENSKIRPGSDPLSLTSICTP